MTDEEFNRVIGHLNAALAEVGADEGAIREVIGAAFATRDLIVVASSASGHVVGTVAPY